jgi:uncharacterized protein (TIGR00255 family)
MIASMTAFGRIEEQGEWGHAVLEIRTVNHRYLETSLRIPEDIRMLENKIRERISKRLKRGKVDCNLRFEAGESVTGAISINTELANKLVQAAESLPITGPTSINPVDILRWPGVIDKSSPDPEIIEKPILALLEKTLDMIVETRHREGEKIHVMISERCVTCLEHVNTVRERLPEIINGLRERYQSKARELSTEIDNDRLEQEMVILAQKLDVAEEVDRLVAHIEEVRRILDTNDAVGRRLDFLMQEMNREANTLGSKAAHVDIGNASIDLKVLIEQMREQIQNIE